MDKFQTAFRFFSATLLGIAIVTVLAFAPRSAHAQAGNVYGGNQAQVTGSIARAPFIQGEPIRDQKLVKAEGSGFMAAILPTPST